MFRTSKFSCTGRLEHAVYVIYFRHPYKHSGRWQDVLDIYIYIYIYIYICVCVCVCMCVCVYIKVNGKDYQAHPAIDQTAYMDA